MSSNGNPSIAVNELKRPGLPGGVLIEPRSPRGVLNSSMMRRVRLSRWLVSDRLGEPLVAERTAPLERWLTPRTRDPRPGAALHLFRFDNSDEGLSECTSVRRVHAPNRSFGGEWGQQLGVPVGHILRLTVAAEARTIGRANPSNAFLPLDRRTRYDISIRLLALSLAFLISLFASPGAKSGDIGFPEHTFDSIDWPLPMALVSGSYANFEDVGRLSASNRYRRAGRPVGRLRMLVRRDDGTKYSSCCTAWLIGNGKIMTNYHCVPTFSNTVLAARLDMGYLHPGRVEQTYPVNPRSIERAASLDYAVLSVNGRPSSRFGTIKLTIRDPENNENLFVIHHSSCKPKKLTRRRCSVYTGPKQWDGRASTQIRHTCDTLGGASGSPLFADSDTSLIGLHNAGSFAYNLAVRMRSIAKESQLPFRDLKARASTSVGTGGTTNLSSGSRVAKLRNAEAALGLDRTERREIQRRLRGAGYDPGPIDGVFGDRTRSAIRRMQKKSGLQVTGYLDKKTLQYLPEVGLAAVLGRPLSPKGVQKNGWTDLHLAAALNLPSDVGKLLDAGADANVRLPGTRRDSEIYDGWQIASLKKFGLSFDYSGSQYAGQTPLHEAARNGANDAVRVLLDNGARLHARDIDSEYTALHYAAMGNSLDVVNTLIDYGLDPNVRSSTSFGDVPIQMAAVHDAREALAVLLYRGADPNVKEENSGETLLHNAAYSGAFEVTDFLLRRGADPNVENNGGAVPAETAAYYGQVSVIRTFFENGWDLEWRNSEGASLLHRAALGIWDADQVVELLIGKGLDANLRDNSGYTALDYLVWQLVENSEFSKMYNREDGYREMVQVLRGLGGRCNIMTCSDGEGGLGNDGRGSGGGVDPFSWTPSN